MKVLGEGARKDTSTIEDTATHLAGGLIWHGTVNRSQFRFTSRLIKYWANSALREFLAGAPGTDRTLNVHRLVSVAFHILVQPRIQTALQYPITKAVRYRICDAFENKLLYSRRLSLLFRLKKGTVGGLPNIDTQPFVENVLLSEGLSKVSRLLLLLMGRSRTHKYHGAGSYFAYAQSTMKLSTEKLYSKGALMTCRTVGTKPSQTRAYQLGHQKARMTNNNSTPIFELAWVLHSSAGNEESAILSSFLSH